jgi:hypothetical protein
MKKKANLTIYRLLAFVLAYLILVGIALYHYYLHYVLLQSGMVLLLGLKFFLLPIYLLSTLLLYRRVDKMPFRWSRLLDFAGGGLVFTVVAAFLFLGIIPFVNRSLGGQKVVVLSGSLVKKTRESGRGGANRQYYATVYDRISRQQYTLRGSQDYFYDKRVSDTLTVALKEGVLGILYLEQGD